jgi:murein DD-endopeptidase MepM/ murein hydrolase activator NlpD
MRARIAIACLAVVGCATVRSVPDPSRRANCAWRVCLTQENGATGRVYRVDNGEPVPVTVGLTFRALQNLRAPLQDTVRRIVEPHSTALITLTAVRRGRPVSADVAISIDLGSSATQPDSDFVYAVPFGGSARRPLIQGYGGEGTHQGSMQYSLDFGMPTGTPVLAAREGVVLYLQDGFTQGGADPALLERANLVVIVHSDFTMASYGHLAPGLAVSVGDTVQEGELLGRSGRTGFAGQPHLHFHVGLRVLGDPGRTIPIRLRDWDGVPIELVAGSSPGRAAQTRAVSPARAPSMARAR